MLEFSWEICALKGSLSFFKKMPYSAKEGRQQYPDSEMQLQIKSINLEQINMALMSACPRRLGW